MSEQSEREINTFDFLKFGKLTLTEKALKGVIFSFQRPARDKKQIGNTIAGNPCEIKVEHPIDAQLDRISRVDVNEGVLIGPVIYLWDAFVVLAMIVVFRFISNYMWSWFAWTKWFSIALLYGIYWGHDWVKRWVNFHFIFDGAPYRVLVDKSRRAELEQFVEAIKSARTVAYPSATALVPDAPRQQQVKLGMIIMSVACVIALILACSIGGCGGNVGSGSSCTGTNRAEKIRQMSAKAQTEMLIKSLEKYLHSLNLSEADIDLVMAAARDDLYGNRAEKDIPDHLRMELCNAWRQRGGARPDFCDVDATLSEYLKSREVTPEQECLVRNAYYALEDNERVKVNAKMRELMKD